MTKTERSITQFRVLTRNIRTSTSIALWTFAVCAIGLLIASFIVPPTGIIDPSTLRGASLLFAFGALFVAREAFLEGMGVKVTHGDTTIEVKDQDGQPAEAIEADGDPGRQE